MGHQSVWRMPLPWAPCHQCQGISAQRHRHACMLIQRSIITSCCLACTSHAGRPSCWACRLLAGLQCIRILQRPAETCSLRNAAQGFGLLSTFLAHSRAASRRADTRWTAARSMAAVPNANCPASSSICSMSASSQLPLARCPSVLCCHCFQAAWWARAHSSTCTHEMFKYLQTMSRASAKFLHPR